MKTEGRRLTPWINVNSSAQTVDHIFPTQDMYVIFFECCELISFKRNCYTMPCFLSTEKLLSERI